MIGSRDSGVAVKRALLLAVLALVFAAPTADARTRFTYRFPVIGHHSYGRVGSHSGYPAADIIAKCGLPVVSPVDGTVLEADDSNLWAQGFRGGPYRGGIFVSILGVDGVRYYGSHLSKITDGIEAGVQVVAGQRIGDVGRTGRAGACHLHFGISPVCAGTGDCGSGGAWCGRSRTSIHGRKSRATTARRGGRCRRGSSRTAARPSPDPTQPPHSARCTWFVEAS